MSNWRDNPNLVECFENCVAMLHDVPARLIPLSVGAVLRQRRKALGLSQFVLGLAAGYPPTSASQSVSQTERDRFKAEKTPIPTTLDRLEAAKRAQS